MGAFLTNLLGPARPARSVWERNGVPHGPGAWGRVGSPASAREYWRSLAALGGAAAGQSAAVLWLAMAQDERDAVAAEFEEWKRAR